MAVEVGARCGHEPDSATTARVTGLVMRAVLGVTGVDAVVENCTDAWTVHWGGAASALAIPISPGGHEFGAAWYLSVQPGARGMDLPLLLAIVVAAAAALTTGGVVFDEVGLLGGDEYDPGTLLDRLLVSDKLDEVAALHALGFAGRDADVGD
jgi:cation transport ATPase